MLIYRRDHDLMIRSILPFVILVPLAIWFALTPAIPDFGKVERYVLCAIAVLAFMQQLQMFVECIVHDDGKLELAGLCYKQRLAVADIQALETPWLSNSLLVKTATRHFLVYAVQDVDDLVAVLTEMNPNIRYEVPNPFKK